MQLKHLKALKNPITIVSIILCVLMVTPAISQYKLLLEAVDGGGGVCSGGPYTLTATITQADTDFGTGGDYELMNGSWLGPQHVVELADFAWFADYWLDIGPDVPADLDNSETVDFLDLQLLASYWLNYCPANWQLSY